MFKSVGKHLSPPLVISCAALFIALGSTGVAATGKAFILGKVNAANKTTAIKSGKAGATLKVTNTGAGPAASFNTGAGKPPFTVNRQTTVTNLSADLLDGLDSLAFLQTGTPAGGVLDGTFSALTLDDGAVTSAKVLDDSQLGGGLGQADLVANAVGSSEIVTDAVGATEIQDNAIDAGEVVDFGLANQDIGVLYAEVSAAAVLDSSSGGGVVATRIGAVGGGTYEVDFGLDVSACTAVATIGGSGTGVATGEINVADRGGNVEAVFVDTNDSGGAATDRPFRLIVVC